MRKQKIRMNWKNTVLVRLGHVKLLDLLESWKVMVLPVTGEKRAKCR